MIDFFISYNKADRAWAQWIAWQLEDAKYTTFIEAWDFLPGCNFALEMDKAARGTMRTIAVLSPDYLAATYTHPEWASAFSRDPQGTQRCVLPVRVRECQPQGLLAQVVYIDVVGLDEEEARAQLLRQVSSGRAKPSLKPGFPGEPARAIAERPPFPPAAACGGAPAPHAAAELPPDNAPDVRQAGASRAAAVPIDTAAALSNAVSGAHLEPEIVQHLEHALTTYLGPIAKVLVHDALRKAQTMDDLRSLLAYAIPAEKERAAFLRRTVTIPSERLAPVAASPPRIATDNSALSPAQVEKISHELTERLGPIATVLVQRAALSAHDRDDFCRRLARQLPDEGDGIAFFRRWSQE